MAAVAGRLRGIKMALKKTLPMSSNQSLRAETTACLATSAGQFQGAATFGLGTWQLFRREKKIELLEHRKKRLEQDPVPLSNFLSNASNPQAEANINSLEFRKVVCKGVYDEAKSIYVGPRSRSVSGITENGYYVVTPLMPAQKNNESVQLPLLVNRGWVPRSWRDKSSQSPKDATPLSNTTSTEKGKAKGDSWWKFWFKQPAIVKDMDTDHDEVKVIGVIRGSENPSIFVPPNDPESGQWFYVDVPAIARAVGLPENTFYVEEIEETVDASNPYPIPKDASTFVRYSVMPQDHLNYALTWYTLSAATTFMAKKRLQKKTFRK
ncbi:surfeit locus protein 1 isoform X2 [Cryptomeria japonica]|uniref:surfeit locus protein 1 isoform X2 n=1 Tax=Cryptomeria japonica TaxID=3369 RepID=UPI0027DAA448|nr:surfeit locus protein 1 isoform X2 [Cryptomeria japonica]